MGLISMLTALLTIVRGFLILVLVYNGLIILTSWIFSFTSSQTLENKHVSSVAFAISMLYLLSKLN